MAKTFVQLARDDVNQMMEHVDSYVRLGESYPDRTLDTVLSKMVGAQIMLLRAVEEVEARCRS